MANIQRKAIPHRLAVAGLGGNLPIRDGKFPCLISLQEIFDRDPHDSGDAGRLKAETVGPIWERTYCRSRLFLWGRRRSIGLIRKKYGVFDHPLPLP